MKMPYYKQIPFFMYSVFTIMKQLLYSHKIIVINGDNDNGDTILRFKIAIHLNCIVIFQTVTSLSRN